MADNDDAKKPPTPVRALILKAEQVIVLPEGTDSVDEKKLREALGISKGVPVVTGEAWMIHSEQTAENKKKAIEAYAGLPDDPDAKPGRWKAIPLTNWRGGVVYVLPEKPKVEASKLVD